MNDYRPKKERVNPNEHSSLSNDLTISRLLVNYPKMRLILISADNNWLHVYQKQEFLLTQATDLIDLVRAT